MKETEKKTVTDRRSFLKLAGLGSLAGGAALVTAGTPAEACEDHKKDGKDGKLYRETAHIRRYYDLARA